MLLVSMIGLAATSAHAGEKAGVTMPDRVMVGDKQLVLNGMGLREATFLKIDVYVAGLYVEHPSSDPGQLLRSAGPKRIVLHFVHDVGHKDIIDAWHAGFRNNATVPLEKLRLPIAQLDAWTPGFHSGDTLTFTYIPGTGVTVDINGQNKGVIPDQEFARSLFAIWLGPRPPTADVKRGLLGAHPVAAR
jgi:hypothetical protein